MKASAWMRFAARVARSGFGRPGSPYKLNFSVTGRCNCRCSHCHIWKTSCDGELSLDEISRFFERSNRFSWIDVTGGEIFLREDIEDVFEVILGNCPNLVLLHFPTNGTMPESAERLAKRIVSAGGPRLYVTVSMDGPRGRHDEFRGLSGCFDRACETYRRLREVPGCRVYFGMTLRGENLLFDETLAELEKHIPGVGVRDFHFNLPHRSAHYYANMSMNAPDAEAMESGFLGLLNRRRSNRGILDLLEKRYAQGVSAYCRTGMPPIPCAALTGTVFVHHTGVVYPCTIWNRPLGSLRENDFDLARILRHHTATEAYHDASDMRCPGCWTPCEAFPAIAKRLGLPFRQLRLRDER